MPSKVSLKELSGQGLGKLGGRFSNEDSEAPAVWQKTIMRDCYESLDFKQIDLFKKAGL